MASLAQPFAQLAKECEAEGLTAPNAEKIGRELAKAFNVRADEVGLLRVESGDLVFCYPAKLQTVGRLPLNTKNSVAVRTANNRRAEIINHFAKVKHTTIFEAVQLSDGEFENPSTRIIQKLMSVPVVNGSTAVGVIQISRKGSSATEAGADFTPTDLHKLVSCAKELAKCFK